MCALPGNDCILGVESAQMIQQVAVLSSSHSGPLFGVYFHLPGSLKMVYLTCNLYVMFVVEDTSYKTCV